VVQGRIFRIEYDLHVLDPGACDVEGQHRRGHAVSLSDQAGLAVDLAIGSLSDDRGCLDS
jgi:hypothetical protein